MAITPKAYNYRLLNAWASYNEVSVWNFNQITGDGVDAPLSTPGQGIFVQPERDLILRGILQAYSLGTDFIRTFHRPDYAVEHVVLNPYERLRRQLVQTRYHHVQAIGQRATTVIESSATVVYSDEDGDGVDETATITVPTTVTDVTEIQTFFRVADGAPGAADRRYEIEPLTVTLSGGNAIITGARALFVKPSIWKVPYLAPNWNSSSKNYGSTMVVGNFVTEVDVYRVYPDATNAVAYGVARNCTCGYETEYGSANILDSRLGMLELCPPSPCHCGYFRYVDIHYMAGIPLTVENTPDPTLELAFVRLTNAMIPRTPPNLTDNSIFVWVNDATVYTEGEALPWWENNPFGARVGQIDAWRMMDNDDYRVGSGGVIGAGMG
jgi:hypothetical protein